MTMFDMLGFLILREIRTAKSIGIDLINFHANLNGMFYGEKRQALLNNLIKSLREIVTYAKKSKVKVMLENVPISNGIHNIDEFNILSIMSLHYLFI